jgi:predicted cobalt transporter CbtA
VFCAAMQDWEAVLLRGVVLLQIHLYGAPAPSAGNCSRAPRK